MKLGKIFVPRGHLDGKPWEVVEVLNSEAGIYTIRALFDQACTTDKLYVE